MTHIIAVTSRTLWEYYERIPFLNRSITSARVFTAERGLPRSINTDCVPRITSASGLSFLVSDFEMKPIWVERKAAIIAYMSAYPWWLATTRKGLLAGMFSGFNNVNRNPERLTCIIAKLILRFTNEPLCFSVIILCLCCSDCRHMLHVFAKARSDLVECYCILNGFIMSSNWIFLIV